MNLKVGNKVKIVDKPMVWWNHIGLMDRWCNSIMTIKDINDYGEIHMEEDQDENYGYGWTWNKHDIEEVIK